MRLTIQGKEVEVRVQERRIVVADFIHKGKVVASGVSTCAPVDTFDLRTGEITAVNRAAIQMLQVQNMADQAVRKVVGDVMQKAGVISAQIELPRISMVHEMFNEIMKKLDIRRAKRMVKEAGLVGAPILRAVHTVKENDDRALEGKDDCNARSRPETDGGYWCTKPKGHSGDHAAHVGRKPGERPVAKWA